MIRVVDAGCKLYPMVSATLFVDDLAADMMGPLSEIVKNLGGFIQHVADFVYNTGQELSKTKCLCTATTTELGKALTRKWGQLNIKFARKVKALGVGLGAGVRRNMGVMRSRLGKFRKRLGRFRRLRKVGVNTARLVRTGLRAIT